MSTDDTIVGVDLFCGAGGFSEALRQVADESDRDLVHAAINHWEPAIQSHEANHPDALQKHSKVEQCHPPDVVREALGDPDADLDVDILTAGPECTHFSTARGGKPVNEQKRMSPWQVLDWLEKLRPSVFVIENVEEIQDWGPVVDGQPTRDGSIFSAWIDSLNALGYSVDWTVLNAADYGDPTSRDRFFLIGRTDGSATFPDPTHSDADPDKPDRRTAAEIIDWSDSGQSIWTRDITEPRVNSPPKDTTMARIAEGIRRHCEGLDGFADALDELGRDEIRHLREERLVPRHLAGAAARTLDEPFLVPAGSQPAVTAPSLVKYYGTSPPQPISDPLDSVTSGGLKHALSTTEAYILRQQDGASPPSVDRPLPTIAKSGHHALVTPSTTPLVMPKNGPHRGIHSNSLYEPDDRPLHTVTADPRAKLVQPSLTPMYNSSEGQRPRTRAVDPPLMTVSASKPAPAALTRPSLLRWSHGGATLPIEEPMPTIATERGGVYSVSHPSVVPFVDDYEVGPQPLEDPLGTITSKDRFALVVPELWPWGLDVRYRMLQPRELKAAQGFPDDYELCGTKTERTAQIGNAVPVNLAKAPLRHLLQAEDPSLGTFGGGLQADEDYEVPEYPGNVATDGGQADD